jgi:hypothetical protein
VALLGDILFSVRNKIPDLPPALPAQFTTVSLVGIAGSTLPAQTYYASCTQRTNWGETSSTEFGPFTVGANQGIQAVFNVAPGVVALRLYLTMPGGVAGSECLFLESTNVSNNVVVISSLSNVLPGSPPTRSTAYLMDSDGPQFGASTVYSWLNEGLAEFSRVVGGILDYSGVPTLAGQPLYVCPGEWLEISDVWYDGYWVQGGKRSEFFRRNSVTTSILSRVTVSVTTNQQVIEVNYQPDRTAGTALTSNAMATTDTQVSINNTGFSYLPFGFAQFSGPLGTEIVAYSSLANGVMSGLIRSLGSTTAQAWPSGTTVTELSLFWCGKRIFSTKYYPGQSGTTLQAPHGWAAILPIWMLAQAKRAEQDIKEAMGMEKDFREQAKEWFNSNKGVARFVQVGGSGMPLTFNDTVAGGVIIPGP